MRQLPALQNLAALAARLLLAAIFVIEGRVKILDPSGPVSYMEAYGVPGRLLPLVIATELGGGLLVALGLFTRIAAIALTGFALLTAYYFHRDFADVEHLQLVHFLKNLAIAGGFLMLFAHGPGEWSIDRWWARRRSAAGTDR